MTVIRFNDGTGEVKEYSFTGDELAELASVIKTVSRYRDSEITVNDDNGNLSISSISRGPI